MNSPSTIRDAYAVGVFGISGVGKTSLIGETIVGHPRYLHLQASALIKAGIKNVKTSSEDLRTMARTAILENQSLLVGEFCSIRRAKQNCILVLDAHSIIDTDEQTLLVPTQIISDLNLHQLIFVRDSPVKILKRRQNDITRARPNRSLVQIALLQEQALDQCQEYSRLLRLPLNLVAGNDAYGLGLALAVFRGHNAR